MGFNRPYRMRGYPPDTGGYTHGIVTVVLVAVMTFCGLSLTFIAMTVAIGLVRLH